MAKAEDLLEAFGPVEGDKPDDATASKEGLAAGLAALRAALRSTQGGQDDDAEAASAAKAARAAKSAAKEDEVKAKKAADSVWTEDELSWFAKGTKKFPAGAANRWETVANYINVQMGSKLLKPKTKEGVLAKYTQISQALASGGDAAKAPPAAAAMTPAAAVSAAAVSAAATAAAAAAEVNEGADAKWPAAAQQQLEAALAKHPATMDKAARWAAVSKEVDGKNKKQCVERFKFLRAKLSAAK
jgi:DnaJ family protein C protein 2